MPRCAGDNPPQELLSTRAGSPSSEPLEKKRPPPPLGGEGFFLFPPLPPPKEKKKKKKKKKKAAPEMEGGGGPGMTSEAAAAALAHWAVARTGASGPAQRPMGVGDSASPPSILGPEGQEPGELIACDRRGATRWG